MEITETSRGLATVVTVRQPRGIHARPSARVSQLARTFDADIWLIADQGEVDAKSMVDVLSLALQYNDPVTIMAQGPQARMALEALGSLLGAGEI